MKRCLSMLAGAGLLLAGCPQGTPNSWAPANGSLAIHGDTLFVAHRDGDSVVVIDAARGEALAEIPVGKKPERIVAADDGSVFVSLRGERSVAKLVPSESGDYVLDAVALVGAEPVGLSLSLDQGTLLVAVQESGTLAALDTQRLEKLWEVQLGDHPRDVTVVGETAFVAHWKTGQVSQVDLSRHEAGGQAIDLTQSPGSTSRFGGAFRPRVVGTIVPAPGGDRIFVASNQARADSIASTNGFNGTPSTAEYYAAAPGAAPVVTGGISTVDLRTRRTLSEPAQDPLDANFPPAIFADMSLGARDTDPAALKSPTAAVVDPTGEWMYAVGKSSNNLVVFSTRQRGGLLLDERGVYASISVGRGPTGVALSADGRRAFVHASFDHRVVVVQRNPAATRTDNRLQIAASIPAGHRPDWLTPEIDRGRTLFNDGVSGTMTVAGGMGVSCAGCHPEGRDDGHEWLFVEGARNTPLLATGFLGQTAPFHWDGSITTFHDLQRIVTERMGGQQLPDTDFEAILAFLESPAILQPDNPNRSEDGHLTPAQQRGRDLFMGKAGCIGCHTGPTTTDNANHDVGVVDDTDICNFADIECAFQTPSLRHVYTSGPWLHTGEARDLRERFDPALNAGERHGNVSALSPEEIDDLVAYLKTL